MKTEIRTRPSELERMLGKVIWYIESALELDEHLPHCTCCGETENLVSGASASGDTIYLCQAAAREALSEKG